MGPIAEAAEQAKREHGTHLQHLAAQLEYLAPQLYQLEGAAKQRELEAAE